jgi:hypothetical protein
MLSGGSFAGTPLHAPASREAVGGHPLIEEAVPVFTVTQFGLVMKDDGLDRLTAALTLPDANLAADEQVSCAGRRRRYRPVWPRPSCLHSAGHGTEHGVNAGCDAFAPLPATGPGDGRQWIFAPANTFHLIEVLEEQRAIPYHVHERVDAPPAPPGALQ